MGLSSDDLITRVLGRPDPSVSGAHSRYIGPYLGRMRPLAGAADLLRSTGRLGLNVVLAASAKALSESGTDPARAVMVWNTWGTARSATSRLALSGASPVRS